MLGPSADSVLFPCTVRSSALHEAGLQELVAPPACGSVHAGSLQLFNLLAQKSVAPIAWLLSLRTAQLGKGVWPLKNFLNWALSTFFFFKNHPFTALARYNFHIMAF